MIIAIILAAIYSSTTLECMSCHDGTVAGILLLEGKEDPSRNHPVDILYPSTGDFVPLADLDERLVLEDGLVTCKTCHGKEVPEQSQLCLSCHLK